MIFCIIKIGVLLTKQRYRQMVCVYYCSYFDFRGLNNFIYFLFVFIKIRFYMLLFVLKNLQYIRDKSDLLNGNLKII